MSDFIEIEILNWEKYNPKRDQKSYTWLRLDNSIATDPQLFGLEAEQRYVWVIILCMASQQNAGTISIARGYLEHLTGVSAKKIAQLIEFLQKKPIIVVHDRARSRVVVDTTPTYVRTDVRTNETNETNEPPATESFDFASLAEGYPNTKGRSEGVARLTKLITTPEAFECFAKAVRNYAEQCRLDATESKYIKHFSSFVGSDRTSHPWMDWVDHVPTRPRGAGAAKTIVNDRNEDLDAKVFGDSP